MRVWIINHYSMTPEVPGGTRHFSLARALTRMGHDVTLIASSFHHGLYKQLRLAPSELYKHEMVDEVRFVWLRGLPYASSGSAKRVLNMIDYAWKVVCRMGLRDLPPPDVVIGCSVHLFAPLAAYWLSRHYRTPFVLEIRDIWPQTLVDIGGISRYHPFVLMLSVIERFVYAKADHVITALPMAGKYIVEKSRRKESIITWIPNFIDLAMVPPPYPPKESSVFTVMYAGTHGTANDLMFTVKAAEIIQEEGLGDRIRFRFIGDGPSKSALKEYSATHNVRNVIFEDAVPKAQIYALLSEADAFIVSLKQAGNLYRWGISLNKLYDYLAMARPILCAIDVPEPSIYTAKAGIVVQPENAQAIANAVKVLAAMSREERWQMGLRGRTYVEQHYDVHSLAQKLDAIIRTVVARNTKRNA